MQKCCEGGVTGIWCNHDRCTGPEDIDTFGANTPEWNKKFYAATDAQQKLLDERMYVIARNGNDGDHYPPAEENEQYEH